MAGKRTISNEVELQQVLIRRLRIAFKATLAQCLDKLKDIIESEVYEAYEGDWAKAGLRTYQFENSFYKRNTKVVANEIIGGIEQNFSVMQKIPLKNGITIHKDKRQLAEIIETGIGYTIGNPPARPFWSKFETWLYANAYDIFKNECSKVGLKGVFTSYD